MPSLIDENTQYLDNGKPIVNGYIYIGTQNSDPALPVNQITIYSDRDLTIPISNPQRTGSDGRAVNKVWVPGKYSMVVQDANNVQKLADLDLGESPQTGITNLTNVLGVDAITAESSPAIVALADKEIYNFTAAGVNTGAVTLQIGTTPAKAVKKYHNQPLVAGDITVNQNVVVMWNKGGDSFDLLSNPGERSPVFPANQIVPANPRHILYDYDAYELFGVDLIPQTSGSVTLNSTADSLSYTKIGRMVHVQGSLTVSSVSAPVGWLLMQLPFPRDNTLSDQSGTSTFTFSAYGLTNGVLPANALPYAIVVSNGVRLFIANMASSTLTNLSDYVAAGSVIGFDFCYHTSE